ncbi:hypothetical protein F4677DRAFT_338500 [Hypoxylon crocopeplum]|nr:hypothetical protein F4677DRAFT_338500 [Hypoxylon crocopeplum]
MDRDSPNTSGALATKPNGSINGNGNGNGNGGKNSTQRFGNRRALKKHTGKPESKESITSDTDASTSTGSRHPLYSGPKYIPNTSSFSASAPRNSESSRETRIPRLTSAASITASPTQQNHQSQLRRRSLDMRQPMNIKSAFALAQKQETDDQLDNFSIKQAFNMASAEMNRHIDGSPSPAPRIHPRRESYSNLPQRRMTSGSNGDLGRHLEQFDRDHQLGAGSGPLNGLFGRTRVGPKVSETGNVLAKKASDSSLRGSPARRRSSQWEASPRKEENAIATNLIAGSVGENADKPPPIPSIEYESASDERVSPINRPTHLSPEKSYNWHLDADFTAQDLQVSNSPRIRTSKSNGESSRRSSSATSSPVNNTPNMRRSNTRINQIRQKEIEAANAVLPEEDLSLSRRSNSRLDEVRAREIEALSKRAVATSRLDEIRVKNSEARPETPETGRSSNREELRGSSLAGNELTKTPENKTGSEIKERTADTPVTISRHTNDHKSSEPSEEKREANSKAEENKDDVQLPRNDSHDLLRRLARATSNSPPAEKTKQQTGSDDLPSKGKSESREDSRSRLPREEIKSKSPEVKNLEVRSSKERLTVGFAGLRRVLSSDSIREKRASLPGSEADPTDRIEAEMKLFAPLDNYSEKGSVRAPSPVSSEPDEEETPRPNRIDRLMQPTPRVTGAFVDTPATVKVKQENRSDDKMIPNGPIQAPDIPKVRRRSSSEPLNEGSIKPEKGDIANASKKALITRSSSVPTASRRARSASRRRHPRRPIINTAKPPSVKDDIRAILCLNQIDDSTLDDFDSILADEQIDSEELEQMVNDTKHKIDSDLEIPGLSEHDRELQVYDRMSKSLKTGLLGIRSAKKGIERLEDKVMHTEHKADQAHTDLNTSSSKPETRTPVGTSDATSVTISIPSLYRKSPKFRLTKLGLLTLIMSIWYILESIFCALYTPQYNCTPDLPCDWSPNEPYFPYAMPFMLDEWATGGKGRALTWRAGEEMGDILADVSDWITSTDFTQFDEKYMNVWERKRHRRRLRKRGLIPRWGPPSDYRPIFAEWNAARLAGEDGEEDEFEEEDETMSADVRVK